jgi:hypothetical protein
MSFRIKSTFKPFTKGQKVWLDARNLKLGYNKKITTKREGPFTITEVLGPVNYRLKLPERWKIHNVFHATLLSPYRENEIHGPNFPKPPPDIIDGNEEFEVEQILRHRKRGRNMQFLIKWKGYDDFDSTWEPERNLTHAKDILSQYKRRHKI